MLLFDLGFPVLLFDDGLPAFLLGEGTPVVLVPPLPLPAICVWMVLQGCMEEEAYNQASLHPYEVGRENPLLPHVAGVDSQEDGIA